MIDKIKSLVATRCFRFTMHATDQFAASPLNVADFQHAISNSMVSKRERDETGEAPYKYTLLGRSKGGKSVYCEGKIVKSGEREEFKVISVHVA